MHFIKVFLLFVLGMYSSLAHLVPSGFVYPSGSVNTSGSVVPSSSLQPLKMDNRVVMDPDGKFILLWREEPEEIIFEVQVATLGYIGLGFSYNGGMRGADIFVGWIDENGDVHSQDRHALGNFAPLIDTSQDYQLLAGIKNETHTSLRFSRPWITCDEIDDFQITKDTIRVIWAYSDQAPSSPEEVLKYHDRRGTMSLHLKEAKRSKQQYPSDVRHWDISSPDVEIPSEFDTLYWCKMEKMPNMYGKNKHHFIGYKPLISDENLPFVHHMLVYECHLSQSRSHLEAWVGHKGVQCWSENMPPSWFSCSVPLLIWAVGNMHGEQMPEHVGMPIGEDHGGSTYFMLEIHYNNPGLEKGVIDNSGVRLMLTDKLRQHEAGALMLGHQALPTIIIPPELKWTTVTHCPSECTQKAIPPEGIKSFGAILHTHLLGREIKVQQVRDGKELPTIVEDKNYDFNFQKSRYFSEEVDIKPGDYLKTTCVYDNTQRNVPTFGGFETQDEMCNVYLYYYPKIKLTFCMSNERLESVLDAFGVHRVANPHAMDPMKLDELSDDMLSHNKDAMLQMIETDLSATYEDKFSGIFKSFDILAPSGLEGETFYDIVTNSSRYDDSSLRKLSQAMNDRYEVACYAKGLKSYQGVPAQANVPTFIPYVPSPPICGKGNSVIQ